MTPASLTIQEASEGLRKGDFTAQELTQAVFDRIDANENKVQAFITQSYDLAMQQAKNSDQRLQNKQPLSELDGIPLAIKDNFITKDIRTTCASNIMSIPAAP